MNTGPPGAPSHYEYPDGWLDYYPSYLPPADAQILYHQLLQQLPWRQDQIQLFGRKVPIPRLQCWIGEAGLRYRYSGLLLQPSPWPQVLTPIRRSVSELCGVPFNALLANYYRNERDSVGWHADDEPELGPNPCLASLSLGASRRFLLRHRRTQQQQELWLEDGSLLVMGGPLQHYWQHALPKSSRPLAPRINLTFRYLHNAARP